MFPCIEDVCVKAEMSKYNNCCCDMCFKNDYVVKVQLPYTKYHDGKKLSTKYSEIWMCESCRDKLVKALEMEYPQTKSEGTEIHLALMEK